MKTIAKKLLLLLCLCLSTQTLLAQEAVPFEGEVYMRTMDNVNKMVQGISGNIGNFGRDIVLIIKDNRLLMKDETLHQFVYMYPDSNKVIFFYPLIKMGYSLTYDEYISLYHVFSDNYLSKQTGVFDVKKKMEIVSGSMMYNEYNNVSHIKIKQDMWNYEFGQIGNAVICDIYNAPCYKYKMPPVYYDAYFGGIPFIPTLTTGIIVKHAYEVQIKALGKGQGAFYTEVTNIVERQISDDEFLLPQDVEIKELKITSFKGDMAMRKQQMKNIKYLKKNNMLPSQAEKEKTEYRIDEEWDF